MVSDRIDVDPASFQVLAEAQYCKQNCTSHTTRKGILYLLNEKKMCVLPGVLSLLGFLIPMLSPTSLRHILGLELCRQQVGNPGQWGFLCLRWLWSDGSRWAIVPLGA
eukprot:EG_transcript_41168